MLLETLRTPPKLTVVYLVRRFKLSPPSYHESTILSMRKASPIAISDSIIIQDVYIAIGPFFVVESGGEGDVKTKKENVVLRTFGKSAMRGLRLDALSLIRSVS